MRKERIILGKSHLPLPTEVHISELLLYENNEMYINIPKNGVSLNAGTHFHDGYEFLIPACEMPFIIVDGKEFTIHKNEIFPINPGQVHGVAKPLSNKRFTNILVNKVFLGKIAEEIYKESNVEFLNGAYSCSKNLQNTILMFFDEAGLKQPGSNLILNSLSYSIAVLLLRELKSNLSSANIVSISDSNYRIKQVVDFLQVNFKNDCSLGELSVIANMSSYHFIRVFKNAVGKTPHEYLLDLKINEAKRLLLKKDKSIVDICLESGFNDVSHFTRIFKKRTGLTPKEYRDHLYKT
jgi:AraC family transcriptional regulator